MRRSVRSDGAATRRRLLEAAVRLVARDGLPALTQRAVGAEAGLPAASVTYHLHSTTELRRATLEYAGIQIGQALTARLADAESRPSQVPQICADYAVELVRQRWAETVCTFELLTAAAHEEDLRPIASRLNDRLALLLTPIAGTPERARALGAAVQGCILVALATGRPDDLHDAVLGLVTAAPQDSEIIGQSQNTGA